jgi:hypothetical protein
VEQNFLPSFFLLIRTTDLTNPILLHAIMTILGEGHHGCRNFNIFHKAVQLKVISQSSGNVPGCFLWLVHSARPAGLHLPLRLK